MTTEKIMGYVIIVAFWIGVSIACVLHPIGQAILNAAILAAVSATIWSQVNAGDTIHAHAYLLESAASSQAAEGILVINLAHRIDGLEAKVAELNEALNSLKIRVDVTEDTQDLVIPRS